MKKADVIGFVLFSLVLWLMFFAPYFIPQPIVDAIENKSQGYCSTEFTRLTNAERAKNWKPSLRENQLLNDAAKYKYDDMIAYGYWDHYRPGDGTAPWHFIKQAGYNFELAGENLARGFTNNERVVQAWMESPGHRKNMLYDNYQEVGFYCGYDSDRKQLVVQMFGGIDK